MKTVMWSELSSEEKINILKRPEVLQSDELRLKVQDLKLQVKNQGDKAVRELTKTFDKVELDSFQVSKDEIQSAYQVVDSEFLAALQVAIKNIESFHKAQKQNIITVETMPGVECKQVVRPIEKVGLYVPGGTAPLPSTVMMLAMPAQIAGCQLKVMCTPPRPDGTVDPHILVAADMCKVDEIYKVGGVQAIAAMAYGTTSISKVDKIFGPGNSWVTEAKSQVSLDPKGASIDMPAGPSEVMVVADSTASPESVAADLLSQAEHGADSQVVLVTNSISLIEDVEFNIRKFCNSLKRTDLIKQSLKHAVFIEASDVEFIEIINMYAPEHLILNTKNCEELVDKVNNAGSIFVGPWSPESVGDYASGTNHVLPTYGYAKVFGGVNLDSFMKKITVQKLSQQGLNNIAPTVLKLAETEGLDAHARAVQVRVDNV